MMFIINRITKSIKLDSDISACFDICLDLKQGEPFSPLLFVIFINDVRHQLENGPEGTIGGIDIEGLCFFLFYYFQMTWFCFLIVQTSFKHY